MLKIYLTILIELLLLSCTTKNQQPTSNNSDTTVVDSIAIINNPKNNPSVQIHDMHEIDDAGVLMFPLTLAASGRDGGSVSYSEMPGNSYWNIIFYDSKSAAYHTLTDRKILISNYYLNTSNNDESVTYNSKYIFFKVTLDDYNRDKKLTSSDPEYLFITDRKGNNFKQISPSNYNLKSFQYINSSDKVLMTVTKDSDNDKIFGDKDEVSTFEMDIEKDIKATEIFSSDFKNKLKLLFHKQWEGRND